MRIIAGGIELSRDILKELLSRRVLSVVGMLVLIFLLSGGIYVIVVQPGPAVATSSGGSSFIANSSSAQTSVELIVAFVLILGGSIGFILLESSFKKSFDLSGAKVKYTLAIILVVLCILLLEYLAYVKVS